MEVITFCGYLHSRFPHALNLAILSQSHENGKKHKIPSKFNSYVDFYSCWKVKPLLCKFDLILLQTKFHKRHKWVWQDSEAAKQKNMIIFTFLQEKDFLRICSIFQWLIMIQRCLDLFLTKRHVNYWAVTIIQNSLHKIWQNVDFFKEKMAKLNKISMCERKKNYFHLIKVADPSFCLKNKLVIEFSLHQIVDKDFT